MDKNYLIQFKNVSKKFDQQIVLNGVDLTISRGEITTIIGMRNPIPGA